MAKGTAAAQAEVVDNYDLQSGELTKQMVADRLHCSPRAVEIWKKDGKLAATKVRRRVTDERTGNPVIKQVLIFMVDDVEKFEADRNAAEQPAVSPNMAMTAARGDAARQDLSIVLMHQIAQATGIIPNDRKPFIPIAEAAAEYDLSVPGINQLIDDGLLRRISGKNGKAMVSRRQIESL